MAIPPYNSRERRLRNGPRVSSFSPRASIVTQTFGEGGCFGMHRRRLMGDVADRARSEDITRDRASAELDGEPEIAKVHTRRK